MNIFKITDLRERPSEIIKNAEQGHLSLVTKRGQPVFLAVPFQEEFMQMGLHKMLSLQFLKQGSITLRQAAKLANLSMEEMMALCSDLERPLLEEESRNRQEEQ